MHEVLERISEGPRSPGRANTVSASATGGFEKALVGAGEPWKSSCQIQSNVQPHSGFPIAPQLGDFKRASRHHSTNQRDARCRSGMPPGSIALSLVAKSSRKSVGG